MAKRFFLLLLWQFVWNTIFGASVEYGKFDHYTTKDGMVSNRIYSICTDKNGFVWIATDFGLEQFDGSSFIHHRINNYPELERENFLFVKNLPNDNISAGGYYGLFVEYDQLQDTFLSRTPEEYYQSFFKETIGIYYTPHGKRIAYSSCGAYTFDSTNQTYRDKNALFNATKNLYIRTLYQDEKDRYWIGSMDSLIVYHKNGTIAYRYRASREACGFIRSITPIHQEGQPNRLLISNQLNELWLFNSEEDTLHSPIRISIPFACVTDVIQDKTGRYWFATDGYGLWYTDDIINNHAHYSQIIPYNTDPDEVKKIYCIMEDDNGNIWIGTQNSGLWKYQRGSQNGISISWLTGFPKVVCSSFLEDDNKNLIVGVDGGGLYAIDTLGVVSKLKNLPNNNVAHIARTDDGICYVATWGGGLFRFNLATHKIEKEEFEGISNPCNTFFGVNVSPQGTIFACTSGDGYYVKKKGASTWQKLLPCNEQNIHPNKWIFACHEATNGNTWILTSNSLWLEKDSKFYQISENANDIKNLNPFEIFDITPGDNGEMIAASNRGLVRYNANGLLVDSMNFLPACKYRIILRDDLGTFWAAGDDGIITFDNQFKTYHSFPASYTDIKTNFYFFRSGFKDSKGKLYFGTNDGFICIDPAHLKFENTISHLAFDKLFIGNEKVHVHDNPLNGVPLCQKEKLELPYGQTDISIQIKLTDFDNIDKTECQYRLEGLQKQWNKLSPDRMIHFSHIPTGSYTLQVKAYRSNKNCEVKQIDLSLIVLPPWWNTWWFYTLVGLTLVLFVVGMFHWRMRLLIYQRNKLNDEVESRTLELKNALKDKDNIISVIGHDLKNPMFAIVVALENWLHKSSTLSDESKTKLIVDVHDSAKTLQGEMLKLLDWAHSKQDDIVCKTSDIDLMPLVEEAIQLTNGMLKRKEIQCNVCNTVKHKAKGDPRMISAVIRNILSNAVKFTPVGGSIHIQLDETTEHLSVSIKDSGIGMSEKEVTQLLNNEPVNSKKGTNQEEGSGLGLRFCQKYIALNQGTLTINSVPGQGSTITVHLPISTFLVETNNEPFAAPISSSTQTDDLLTNNTLLVVDDNPLICENMRLLLGEFCEILVAYDGKQAMNLLEQNAVDLILSDVEMPVMDGIQLCQQLQQNEDFAHIPVLFLSGRTDEHDRLLGLSQGAIDYIAKPFSQDELLAKLKSLLKMRKQYRAYLLAQIMQREEKTQPNNVAPTNPFLIKFMELIRENYTNSELSIDELAEKLYTSRSTLFRRIKTIVGKSPIELLGEYRLNEAMRRIKESDNFSINEIAYSVGFTDPSYFSKRFKAYFGISPTQAKE